MSWIVSNIFSLRAGVLVLLFVALLGPWTFSSDGLPPPEWCNGVYQLVVGDRCVRLVSGAEVLAWSFFISVEFVATGLGRVNALREMGRVAPLFALEFILLTPLLSTLLIYLREESRRRRIIHAAVLGGAVIASLLLMVLPRVLPRMSELSGRLWGGWLYAAIAGAAMLAEVIALANKNPSSVN